MEQRFDSQVLTAGPDPEVMLVPKQRRYREEYKLHILAKADQCRQGEQGAMLRQEGIHSSTLSRWRQRKAAGKLDGQADQQKRGEAETFLKLKRLRQENARLRTEMVKKEATFEVQKNVCAVGSRR